MEKPHKRLECWKKGIQITKEIYRITDCFPKAEQFGLTSQMRRASVSIPSNIAEGDELKTDKQSIHFFYTAKGSAAEVITQASIAFEIGYINQETYCKIEQNCKAISGMLTLLIKARSNTSS